MRTLRLPLVALLAIDCQAVLFVLRHDLADAMSAAVILQGVGEMFALMERRVIRPGDTVACAHCPWMGTTTKFAPHLIACPDQSSTGLDVIKEQE